MKCKHPNWSVGKCSNDVKIKLFHTDCTIYCGIFWHEATMRDSHRFRVSYNNSLRKLFNLPYDIVVAVLVVGLYMGPNHLCCVAPHLLLFFSVSHVTFYKFTSSRHFLIFYIQIYIKIIFYKTSMSIFVLHKISTSILQFL